MKGVKNLGRAFSLIPVKYLLGAAGAAAALVGYGIVKTVITSPVPQVEVKAEAKAQKPLLEAPQSVAVPPAIGAGNLFRKQRADHTPPPPLQPADPNEPVPDVKLVGIIISDTRRVAILDAEVKKYIRRVYEDQLVLSGVKQEPLMTPDGKVIKIIPLKGDKLDSQTFNEGDIVSDYTLARINEDSIELASLASGKRTVIYLDTDQAEKSLTGRMSNVNAADEDNFFKLSGAVAR
ncbi:MAG: hypothetical protein HZA04_03405 [Nitrospinae bacterium]|nr:hypothetical protein [Nitrospinota bacterium]